MSFLKANFKLNYKHINIIQAMQVMRDEVNIFVCLLDRSYHRYSIKRINKII